MVSLVPCRGTIRKAGLQYLMGVVFLAGMVGLAAAEPGREPAKIELFGYTWLIREIDKPEGPRNNIFGGEGKSVILNPDNSLSLRLTESDGKWFAGEVYQQKSLGYGSYVFRVRTPPAGLDSNIVLGFFTYSQQNAYNHREIDIEFSAWGLPDMKPEGQYVLQPYTKEGNLSIFPLPSNGGPASYSFRWQPGRIEFISWHGYGPKPIPGEGFPGAASDAVISHWILNDPKRVPKPGEEVVHMNLYLARGETPPAGNGEIEVIIDGFEFTPEPR